MDTCGFVAVGASGCLFCWIGAIVWMDVAQDSMYVQGIDCIGVSEVEHRFQSIQDWEHDTGMDSTEEGREDTEGQKGKK